MEKNGKNHSKVLQKYGNVTIINIAIEK
jgi:hypothetical protein